MNQIVRGFYEPLPEEERPRLLGLTARAARASAVSEKACSVADTPDLWRRLHL